MIKKLDINSLSTSHIKEVYKMQKEYIYENFHKIDSFDLVKVSIAGYNVLVDKELTTKVKYTDRRNKYVLTQRLNDEAIEVHGELYDLKSPLIACAKDTKRYDLRENLISTPYGHYEKKDNLVFIREIDGYAPREKTVIATDVGRRIMRGDAYGRGDEVYRYRELAFPKEEWQHAPYIDETEFPKDIKERRIGLEYEFGNTYDLFDTFLETPYAKDWQSVRDGSLDNIPQGIEFVSVPFKLSELDRGLAFLDWAREQGAIIHKSCGFHVHIGASDLSFLDISRLVSLCVSLEDEMFALGGRDRKNNDFCKSLNDRFKGFTDIVLPKDKNEYGKKLYKGLNAVFEDRHKQSKYVDARDHTGIRYYWFNIDRFFYKRNSPEEKTVEFRNHKATFNTEDFYNFALICYYIVEFAKEHSKETCSKARLIDIIKKAKLKHRKQLINYIKRKV